MTIFTIDANISRFISTSECSTNEAYNMAYYLFTMEHIQVSYQPTYPQLFIMLQLDIIYNN